MVGLLVGSFLNVVIYRVPIMLDLAWREQEAGEPTAAPGERAAVLGESVAAPGEQATELAPRGAAVFNLFWPPSACTSCGHRIEPWQNIPVLSYLWLRGRCAHCAVSISRRYPLIETATAVLSVVLAYHFGPTWQLAAALPFTWALLALAVIDIDHQILPDAITLPLLWAGVVLALVSVGGEPIFVGLRSSVIGAAAGYTSLWLVYHLFKLLTGKEGMGYGDFKLLGALGAWLGWQQLPLVILLSAAVGAVLGSIILFAGGKSRQTPIPFGPYLAAAGWIALLWGNDIVGWYAQFLR